MNIINIKRRDPIKVRAKKLTDGSESLYLDIYQNGKRSYEFLKLYLLPEINSKIREQNKNTLIAADAIKAQRIVDLSKKRRTEAEDKKRQYLSLADLLEKFKKFQMEKGIKNPGKLDSVIKVILQYRQNSKNWVQKIDKEWIIGFQEWLQTGYRKNNGRMLGKGTILYYEAQLSSALNYAMRTGEITENPFNKLMMSEKIKKPDSQRQYLTVDELRRLADTECKNEMVKSAFLFSCYCGLRISDVRELKVENLTKTEGQFILNVKMKKTGRSINLPLSKNALQWIMGKLNCNEDKIFEGLPCLTTVNSILKNWCRKAGIGKHITYHCSRHTFGTLMITAGVDLYVTSRLMGHSDVRTTQIYAKIVDSKKIEAVKRIDKLFEKK